MRLSAYHCRLAARHLAAQPLRSASLTITLILAFTGYTLLVALGSPFAPKTSVNSQLGGRIYVSALYGTLPKRYARKIAGMNGIKSVAYRNYIPVMCRPHIAATLNGVAAIGGPPSPLVLQSLSPMEANAWRENRHGMLVGDALARRCHWHEGALLSLADNLKVRIVAIYQAEPSVLNQVALVHYDYLDSLKPTDQQGNVAIIDAKAAEPGQAGKLAVTIDARFANSSPPTASKIITSTQGAFARFGNVLKIIQFVMAAVFACALLVTTNVAAHTAAERRTQFAILRVLGFSRSWILNLTVTELLYVAILGCGLGLALGLALLYWIIKPLLGSFFTDLLAVPAGALYVAPAIAAGIVLVSVFIPAWEIFRLRSARLTAP